MRKRQFLRLDYASREIVKATISTAYRLARANNTLLPEDWGDFILKMREKEFEPLLNEGQ